MKLSFHGYPAILIWAGEIQSKADLTNPGVKALSQDTIQGVVTLANVFSS